MGLTASFEVITREVADFPKRILKDSTYFVDTWGDSNVTAESWYYATRSTTTPYTPGTPVLFAELLEGMMPKFVEGECFLGDARRSPTCEASEDLKLLTETGHADTVIDTSWDSIASRSGTGPTHCHSKRSSARTRADFVHQRALGSRQVRRCTSWPGATFCLYTWTRAERSARSNG